MNKQENKRIRILIVDDHPVVRVGLSSMLASHPGIEVTGSASSGEEALEMVRLDMPDLVLLDLRMPGMSGIDTLLAFRKMKASARVIILTSFEMDENIYRAVQAGAFGYLLKDTTQDKMLEAIQTVHSGQRYIPPQIAARLAERLMRSNLTSRELGILELLAKGLTNKQIGSALNISGNTVRNHVNSIMEKMEVADRTEAVALAIQQGILQVMG